MKAIVDTIENIITALYAIAEQYLLIAALRWARPICCLLIFSGLDMAGAELVACRTRQQTSASLMTSPRQCDSNRDKLSTQSCDQCLALITSYKSCSKYCSVVQRCLRIYFNIILSLCDNCQPCIRIWPTSKIRPVRLSTIATQVNYTVCN